MKNGKIKRAVIELLEARQLLSADLTGSFSGSIPTALALHGNNKVTLSVANIGNAAADGPVTIALYASANGTLDAGDTPLFPTIAKKIHLNPNSATKIPIDFASPAGVADGEYFLLADIRPGAAITDGNIANNVVATPSPVSIRKAFVDLTGSVAPSVSGVVAIGGKKHQKPIAVSVVVANDGNVLAKGSLAISLYAATHQTLNSTDTLLITKDFGVSIANGKSKKFVIDDSLGISVPSGTFYILADINSNHSIAESTAANNVVAPRNTVVFSNPLIAPGPFTVGALSSSISTVVARQSQQDQFSITIARAGVNTAVEVDEFDSSGDNLGEIAQLSDDGSASNGDSTANDGVYNGIVAIDSTVAGTRYFAAVLSDPQLSSTRQSGTVSIVATPPPGPTLIGSLTAGISVVVVGEPELSEFSVQVAGANPSTTVEVDELDASGNNLGKLTDLFDDGSPANGDVTAGDGIFSGVNTIGFTAPGTRYFAAVISDPNLDQPLQSAAIAIPGISPISAAQLLADESDAQSINQTAANVFAGNGVVQQSLTAIESTLPSDSNVNVNSIKTTGTSVEWETVDGILQLYSTDLLFDSGIPQSATSSLTPAPVVTDSTNETPAVAAAAGSAGNALVLSPFESYFASTDPSANIASQLTNAGYTVVFHDNGANGAVTLTDYQNFGRYDAIEIFSHGGVLANGDVVFATGVPTSVDTDAAFNGDLDNHSLVKVTVQNGPSSTEEVYGITPAWVKEYSGSMDGTIVYAAMCDTLANQSMANAFLDEGAGAYLGFNDTVNSDFDYREATSTFQTLLSPTNNTIGDIPDLKTPTYDPTAPHSLFTEAGPLTATLPTGLLLKNYDVYVEYNWPQNEADLDSNTTFLGNSVGYALPGGPYLNWSGDDTGYGGTEITTVDINQAYLDGMITSTTTVGAGADWYTPNGGSGPAFITIGLQNKDTGVLKQITHENINPGFEYNGAFDTQYTITVTLGGANNNPTIHIAIT